MTTWLKLLPLELQGIDKYIDPSPEFDKKKDKRVGILPDELRALYTLFCTTGVELDKMRAENHWIQDSSDIKAKIDEYEDKMEALRHIMWLSIKDHFKLWGEGNVGLRKGWVVVTTEPAPSSPLDFFFRGYVAIRQTKVNLFC